MKLKLLKKTESNVRIQLKGEGHTFCNLIRRELWEQKETDAAGYQIEHSLVSEPKIFIDSKKPKKALEGAISSLKKKTKELKSLFAKLK